jgi:hypothetical protein
MINGDRISLRDASPRGQNERVRREGGGRKDGRWKMPNEQALFMRSLRVKQSDDGMVYCIRTGISVSLETNNQYSTLNTRFAVKASIIVIDIPTIALKSIIC